MSRGRNDYRAAISQLCIGGCADGEYHRSPNDKLTVRCDSRYRREHLRFPDGRTHQLWLLEGMSLYDGIRTLLQRYSHQGDAR